MRVVVTVPMTTSKATFILLTYYCTIVLMYYRTNVLSYYCIIRTKRTKRIKHVKKGSVCVDHQIERHIDIKRIKYIWEELKKKEKRV